MEEKLWWIRFQMAFGYGTTRGQKLLDDFDHPSAIFRMSDTELCEKFKSMELNRIREATEKKARHILELCKKYSCSVLTPDDPGYPQRLREIYGYPAVLYVQGSLAGLDDVLTIGMVGTRSCTDYGERAARTIARELAERGIIIVSGMARGLDTVAHTATLQAGGRTIAVTGCGIDRVYPPENVWLRDEILRTGGAIVTEYPPETPSMPRHFPVRNRIISGLSNGVVVVEGSRRSGSLITATHALSQNREVFAVPGSIFSKSSAGANFLLRQGAKAVDDIESILEEYPYLISLESSAPQEKNSSPTSSFSFEESEKNGYNVEQQPEKVQLSPVRKSPRTLPPPSRPRKLEPVRQPSEEAETSRQGSGSIVQRPVPDGLNANQQKIYSILSDGKNRTVEQITAESGLPLPTILSSLTQMELFGLIKPLSGKRFTIE